MSIWTGSFGKFETLFKLNRFFIFLLICPTIMIDHTSYI
jgi:hypothetical protein